MDNKNIGVLLAAGFGLRFEDKKPKQFHDINGKEIISYTIDMFKSVKNMDDFVVVLSHDEIQDGRIARDYNVNTTPGGDSRAHSFKNALDYIREHYPACENVIFHEAARPLVKAEVIEKYFEFLKEYDYVTSCQKITDSLGSYLPEPPNREDYYLIQAPEAYRIELLYKYFNADSDMYFAAHQLPRECKGKLYFDIPLNIKLTTPEDKAIIEAVMKVL